MPSLVREAAVASCDRGQTDSASPRDCANSPVTAYPAAKRRSAWGPRSPSLVVPVVGRIHLGVDHLNAGPMPPGHATDTQRPERSEPAAAVMHSSMADRPPGAVVQASPAGV